MVGVDLPKDYKKFIGERFEDAKLAVIIKLQSQTCPPCAVIEEDLQEFAKINSHIVFATATKSTDHKLCHPIFQNEDFGDEIWRVPSFLIFSYKNQEQPKIISRDNGYLPEKNDDLKWKTIVSDILIPELKKLGIECGDRDFHLASSEDSFNSQEEKLPSTYLMYDASGSIVTEFLGTDSDVKSVDREDDDYLGLKII